MCGYKFYDAKILVGPTREFFMHTLDELELDGNTKKLRWNGI
jgi:hypothetical protein